MIGAILFDVDGTLIDSNDLHASAWHEAFHHFGIDLAFQQVREQVGKGGDNLVPALLPPELAEEKGDRIEAHRSALFTRDYLPRAVPFPGVRTLFEKLYANDIKIVLATSAAEEELRFHRGLLGCEDLIHSATTRDDVDHSKPCPDIFAAARTTVAPLGPDEVLVVGDSPWDMEAAAKARIKAIGVRCGGFSDEVLKGSGAFAIHDGPETLAADFPSWLQA